MSRLLLIIIVLGFIIYGVNKFKKNKPTLNKPLILKITTAILLLLCVLLVLTGRAPWIAALAAGLFALLQRLLPLMLKFLPFIHQQYQKQQTSKAHEANQSEVVTDILRMTLDHDSGQLDGEVLAGVFKNQRLSELEKEQLEQLYAYCIAQDAESVQLLEAYLQKRFEGEWEFEARREQQNSDNSNSNSNSSTMSRHEALSILALADDCSDEDIIQAHRKLIQKLHPDRGGSDYLAAKVNEARRILLKK